MSYLLDQIKGRSVHEAADILAHRHVTAMGHRSGFAKSATGPLSLGDSSLIGAAAGAGIGGLGTLGLDHLSGRGVSARRALYGALVGAVPGTAAGALAHFANTPAEADPRDPKTKPTLSWENFKNLINPVKVPQSFAETVGGTTGGIGGFWAGGKLNKLVNRAFPTWNVSAGDAEGATALSKRHASAYGKVLRSLDEVGEALRVKDPVTGRRVGDPVRAAAARKQLHSDRLNVQIIGGDSRVGHNTAFPSWDKTIHARKGLGGSGVDANRYKPSANLKSYILPTITSLLGWGAGVQGTRTTGNALKKWFPEDEDPK